ncbi:ArnT family glycosyltransferase [Planctomicrobium piriforme]|uniref:Dolichyl-phosphate-mannose-protein mannosyltransferase n=1 Tax=Planctomicrobium piriforme TaxID=1576369 RepID=A0A1I3ASB7_9PLAN|nr:glycosyltransferase family 39 protein [Planctomicrobium piriforme]SFH52629.1 Dolichyl-phosphate-mannose-protein mannosyltransferase [Planctomicrobium piriforme]
MATAPTARGTPAWFFVLAGGLLLAHWLICLHMAATATVTHDEIWHLPVGVRNLREGRFDVERLNPPLTRMWAAIPLVIAGVEVNRDATGPGVGRQFVEDHPQDFARWFFWGRCFQSLWSVATGVLLCCWARQWFGDRAALVTLLLYVTCPNIVAQASIVTPDSGLTFAFIATLWAMFRWCEKLRWQDAAVLALCLGLAQGMKFTAILLAPLVIAIAVVQLGCKWLRREVNRRRVLGQFLAVVLGSFLVLWSSYAFHGIGIPLQQYKFRSTSFETIRQLLSFIPVLPVPLPADYLLGLDEQQSVMESPHPAFLDGQWSLTGFRTYYVKGLLYKVPLVLWVLLALGLSVSLRNRSEPRRRRETWLVLLPVAVLIVVASLQSMQLGVRYILPVLPLLMLLSGRGVGCLPRATVRSQRMTLAAIAIVCGLSLRFHPHHLAYFNELAGGPIGGRYHLLDSNLDWGQDLGLVKKYMDQHQLDSISLAYFGTLPPQLLGIKFELPPSWQPQPGRYAVSVNYVMGRPHVVTQGDGTSRGTDFQEFGYFRFFKPETTLGGSIDIYEITPEQIAELREAAGKAGSR